MSPAEAEQGTATPWPAIAGIIATVSVFAVSQGLTYPLLSFILERQGQPPSLIGLSAAMTPLGFVVSSPLIPTLSRRFGAAATVLGCALSASLLLALIAWRQDVWLWFPLRFLLGFAVNPLYVLSETWMVAITPAAKRGRILGIYTSVISAGFAAGPLTLTLAGTEGWPPFLVGIASFLACAAILLAVLPRLPKFEESAEGGSVMRFVPQAPLLLAAVFVAAAFEQTTLSLMSVYGEAYQRSETSISALLSVFVAGNIALQMPLGMLAERLGSRPTLIFAAVATALGAAILPLVFATPLVWPVAFVWGAVSFGIYTMSLIELGERYAGTALVAGNAAFAMFWGIGGITGPPATGAVMDLVGVEGLPLMLGGLCLALACFQAAGRRPLNRTTSTG
ncbi:MAG: MFS transporter [Mesorhizobium sp.]